MFRSRLLALFPGMLVILVSGCSAQESGRERPGGVPLEPVTAAVRADGSARLVGRGPATRLQVRVRGLPPLEDAYVVWLFNTASNAVPVARVARGTFALEVRLHVDPERYRYLDISREPLDGNANHSGASLLRIPMATLLSSR
jgi:hypothetical protein